MLLRLLGQSVSVLENTNRLIVKLSGDLYLTQPFNLSDQNKNNNSDCECNGDNESEQLIYIKNFTKYFEIALPVRKT